jgi:hypothetical protein
MRALFHVFPPLDTEESEDSLDGYVDRLVMDKSVLVLFSMPAEMLAPDVEVLDWDQGDVVLTIIDVQQHFNSRKYPNEAPVELVVVATSTSDAEKLRGVLGRFDFIKLE